MLLPDDPIEQNGQDVCNPTAGMGHMFIIHFHYIELTLLGKDRQNKPLGLISFSTVCYIGAVEGKHHFNIDLFYHMRDTFWLIFLAFAD